MPIQKFFLYMRERKAMKINFDTIKERINKLDTMASQVDMTKPNTIFQKNDEKLSVSERLSKFFDVADGKNPEWNV